MNANSPKRCNYIQPRVATAANKEEGFNVPAHPVISLPAGSANEGNQLALTVTGRTPHWATPGEKKGFKTHVLSKQGWQGVCVSLCNIVIEAFYPLPTKKPHSAAATFGA